MDVRVFDPSELAPALGAVRAVAAAPTPAQDRFLRLLAGLHGQGLVPAQLPRPTPAELAGRVSRPHARKRLVELAIVMTMVDGHVDAAAAARVEALAAALGVDHRTTGTLRRLAARRSLLVRADVSRRILGRFMGGAWREEGLAGVRRLAGALLKVGEDRATAARYLALGRLPPGSFGRVYFEHCRARGFPFPGQRGGIPERVVFHDLGHVLSGYDTDPDGEIQQAAFQAGFVREAGFDFLFFGIAQFHLGVKLTPVAAAEVGLLDVERVLVALARGAACRVDLSDRWDFWPLLARPLEEVRRQLGIPPRAAPPVGAPIGIHRAAPPRGPAPAAPQAGPSRPAS
jgi:hypothetical protein